MTSTINRMDNNSDDQKAHHIHKQCFNELLEFVRKSLIEKKKFTTIPPLIEPEIQGSTISEGD